MNTQIKPENELFEADELLALARYDIEQGHLDKALTKLKRVLADAAPPTEALAMTARLYGQLGLFKRAQSLFRSYIELVPDAVNEMFQLGMAHFDNNEQKEAQALWQQILDVNPTHAPALFYSALASAQAGELADAKRNLDILLKSAAVDNLYFGRAKELLQSIDGGLQVALAQGQASSPLINAYSN